MNPFKYISSVKQRWKAVQELTQHGVHLGRGSVFYFENWSTQLQIVFDQLTSHGFACGNSVAPDFDFEDPLEISLQHDAISALAGDGLVAILSARGWLFERVRGGIKTAIAICADRADPVPEDPIRLLAFEIHADDTSRGRSDLQWASGQGASTRLRRIAEAYFINYMVGSHIDPDAFPEITYFTSLIGPFGKRSTSASFAQFTPKLAP